MALAASLAANAVTLSIRLRGNSLSGWMVGRPAFSGQAAIRREACVHRCGNGCDGYAANDATVACLSAC